MVFLVAAENALPQDETRGIPRTFEEEAMEVPACWHGSLSKRIHSEGSVLGGINSKKEDEHQAPVVQTPVVLGSITARARVA